MNSLRGYFYPSFTLSTSLHAVHNITPPLFFSFLAHSHPNKFWFVFFFLSYLSPCLSNLFPVCLVSGLFHFYLNSSFVPIFLPLPFSLSFIPVVFTSCPVVKAETSKGMEGMLILSLSAEGDTGKKEGNVRRLRKWHGRCSVCAFVSVCLDRKDHGDSLSDVVCISLPLFFPLPPRKWHAWLVCVCFCALATNCSVHTLCV